MSTRWLSVPPVTRRRAAPAEPLGEARGVVDDGLRVVGELRPAGLGERDGLGGHDVRSGPPSTIGQPRSTASANSCWASTNPPRGPRSDLWLVLVTTWACGTGSKSPVNTLPATRPAKCAMSTIERGADLVGDLAHLGEVDAPRVGRVAGDEDQRAELLARARTAS